MPACAIGKRYNVWHVEPIGVHSYSFWQKILSILQAFVRRTAGSTYTFMFSSGGGSIWPKQSQESQLFWST